MYLELLLSICCFGFICSFILDGNTAPQFSLTIENSIRNPLFSHTSNFTIADRNKTLMSYIEATCDASNNLLNFSMTYFLNFGYFISGFNGISEVSGELYWDLTEHSGNKKSEIASYTERERCERDPEPDYTFLFSIKNVLKDPTFFHTFNLTLKKTNETLLKYMEETCDTQSDFKNFSMTYFPKLGFYVSGFNGVYEISGETYWELVEHSDGKQFTLGAAKYIPQFGDHVAFNLTEISPS